MHTSTSCNFTSAGISGTYSNVTVSYVPENKVKPGDYKINLLNGSQHICSTIIQLK